MGMLGFFLGFHRDRELGLGRDLEGVVLGQTSMRLTPLQGTLAAPLGPFATPGRGWEKPQLARQLYLERPEVKLAYRKV